MRYRATEARFLAPFIEFLRQVFTGSSAHAQLEGCFLYCLQHFDAEGLLLTSSELVQICLV